MIRKRIYLLAAVVVTVLAATTSSRAQHYIGARMGIGSGTARFYPNVEMGSVFGLYSGGVSWKYLSPERIVGGVQVDLMFMQQGYKELEYDYTKDHTYERKINSIMLPIFWQPHAYFARRRLRAFLNLGVTLSYNISSTYVETLPDGTVYKGDYDMVLSKDNSTGYGLCGGFGVGWLSDRWEVFGEFRYYMGYGDIYRNRNKYQVPEGEKKNPLRSPLDGMQFSVGVFYRLGKGDVLSQPASSVVAKLETLEAMKSMDSELEELGIPLTKADERRARRDEKIAEKQRRRNEAAQEKMKDAEQPEQGAEVEASETEQVEGSGSQATQVVSEK